VGHAVTQLVQARGAAVLIPDDVTGFFQLTYGPGVDSASTEMGTRNLPVGKGRPARKADNLTAICEPIFLKNVEASTSQNRMGLHGLLQG
jgi:hypothetical protein